MYTLFPSPLTYIAIFSEVTMSGKQETDNLPVPQLELNWSLSTVGQLSQPDKRYNRVRTYPLHHQQPYQLLHSTPPYLCRKSLTSDNSDYQVHSTSHYQPYPTFGTTQNHPVATAVLGPKNYSALPSAHDWRLNLLI